jgi:hypothetical protein
MCSVIEAQACKALARIARSPRHSATTYLIEFLIVILQMQCGDSLRCGLSPDLRRACLERLSGEPFEENFCSRVDYFLASPFIRPERRRRQAIPVVKIAVFGIILPGVAD